MNIPIVIAGFNRDVALRRLLTSIAKAHYPVPTKLIISIDGGGPDSVIRLAEAFEWQSGQKEVVVHNENLGLRKHILRCGDLSRDYDGIILLEDDLYVSPWFYQYATVALDFYQRCKSICGLSLYSNQYNETALFPFKPLNDGSDVFFMQLPSSWGQGWLKEHWSDFREWYGSNAHLELQNDLTLPSNISSWSDASWKKYFIKYMVERDKFFVYPRNSYTTNFGDKGQHLNRDMNTFQVPLVLGDTQHYRLKAFSESLIKYDVFYELLPECLGKLCDAQLPSSLIVDLHGTKRPANLTAEYVITSKKSRKVQRSFGKRMVPVEMNVINQIEGTDLVLTRPDDLEVVDNISHLIYAKACDDTEQRYYFGSEEVHFHPLKEANRRLQQAEQAVEQLKERLNAPEQPVNVDQQDIGCRSVPRSSRSCWVEKCLHWVKGKLDWVLYRK